MVRVSKDVSNLQAISMPSSRTTQLEQSFQTNFLSRPGFIFSRIFNDDGDDELFFLRTLVHQEEIIYTRRLGLGFFQIQQSPLFYNLRCKQPNLYVPRRNHLHEQKVKRYLSRLKVGTYDLGLKFDIILSKAKVLRRFRIIDQQQNNDQKSDCQTRLRIFFKKICFKVQQNSQNNSNIELNMNFNGLFEVKCLKKWKQKHKSCNKYVDHNL